MDLIDRKYRILQAIIDDYIMTALPVGSRTISKSLAISIPRTRRPGESPPIKHIGFTWIG